jgi:hypothetical protein
MASAREKTPKAEGEVKTVQYLAPGVKPVVQRDPFTIAPELEEIRDREAKANDVDISGSREPISIAPELVAARDEQIKREGGTPVKAVSSEPKVEPKKAAAKKSSK